MPGVQADNLMHVEGRQMAVVHRRDHVPSHYSRPRGTLFRLHAKKHGEQRRDGYVGVDTCA